MKIYKKGVVCGLLAVTLIVAGCQSKAEEPPKVELPVEEPVIVENEPIKEDPSLMWYSSELIDDIDPVYNLTQTSESMLNNLYEGLFREMDGHIHLGMAESETISEDGLTVTFKIRDAYWSDNVPVTAEQFVYGWNRMKESGSPYAYYFDSAKITFFSAPDSETLIVKLSEPNPYLNEYLTFGVFMPQRDDINFKLAPGIIGNGPFEIIEKKDSALLLCKSETYWMKNLISLESIEYYDNFKGEDLHTLVMEDKLDVYDTIGDEMVSQFAESALVHAERDAIYYFVLNDKETPFDDPLYREMIQKGINKETIVKQLYGKQVPAYHMYPERYVSETSSVDAFDHLMDAKLILETKGFPEGVGFETIDLLTLNTQGHVDIANILKVELKKNLGIDIEIDAVPWEEYLEKRETGDYDMVRVGWQGQIKYPGVFLDPLVDVKAMEFIPFEDEGYNKFLEQAKTAENALEYYQVADDTLMQTNIIVPLFYYTDPLYLSQKYDDVQKTHRGILYFGSAEIK